MQLFLIRHAESENNAKPAHQREHDPPITAVGRLQAQHLSDWVKSLRIDTLICSPVRRSLQTTRFISDVTGHHVHVWADVFEEGGIYFGHGPDATAGGPGLTRSDVIAHIGEPADSTVDESITDQGWWGRDRETPEQAIVRAASVTKRIVQTYGHTEQTVALVIHADFKRRLIGQILTGSVDPQRLGALRNTGITKLDYDGQGWHLDWFNSVSHLPVRLITGVET
jgi:2,3-bisphosphoglycerate-dependent phosphoglycerate mutase